MSTILITGVSQRLGYFCSEGLVTEGYHVIGTYRDWNKNKANLSALEKLGVTLIQADFSDSLGIAKFIETVLTRNEPLRAVIHNASSWGKDEHKSIEEQYLHAQEMFNVHSIAPYQINLAFKDLLGQDQAADIVHITDYVVDSGSDFHVAYAASKAALENMTKSFARRFAADIKVNSIAPSLLMFNDHDDEHYKSKALSKSLSGIEPGPQVMLDTILYVLNNDYLTGQCLQLDGGRKLKQP